MPEVRSTHQAIGQHQRSSPPRDTQGRSKAIPGIHTIGSDFTPCPKCGLPLTKKHKQRAHTGHPPSR